MNKNKQAFTLVELIVVITILAILGTIAFISLQGYSSSSRDSVRISDISSMKTSLELFHLNAGKYPLPDDYEIVSYDGDTLWYQGTVGSTVLSSISRNLNKIPLDPLTEREYIYSTTNTRNEFEVLSLLESDLTLNNAIKQTKAANIIVTPRIDGTYNGIFIKTPKYIVPTPSIVTSEGIPSGAGLTLNATNIKSQIINGGNNIPNHGNVNYITGGLDINFSIYTGSLTKDSIDAHKALAMQVIQAAYTGTILASDDKIAYILSKTSTEELVDTLDIIVFNTGVPTTSSNTTPTYNFSFSTPTDWVQENSVDGTKIENNKFSLYDGNLILGPIMNLTSCIGQTDYVSIVNGLTVQRSHSPLNGNAWALCIGNQPMEGKFYFELDKSGRTNGMTDRMGFTTNIPDSISNMTLGNTTILNSFGYDGAGKAYYNGNLIYTQQNIVDNWPSYYNGRAMLAYDQTTGNIWIGEAGVWFNSGNPATGNNPTYQLSPLTSVYPIVQPIYDNSRITLVAEESNFLYTTPSGFIPGLHTSVSNGYNINNPYYITTSNTNQFDLTGVGKIKSVSITNIQSTNTSIKALVSFDGRNTWKMWNGSSWVTKTLSTLQEGSTIEQIEAGLTNYGITSETKLDFAFDLSTTDSSVTPEISGINVNYTE